MLRTLSLGLFLFAFWLLLSGHYTPWLIGSGLVISFGLAFAGRYFGFSDEEGHPVERLPAGIRYWSWLAVEIVKSSLSVARVIVNPKLPIAPRLFEIQVGPKSSIAVATYANSITLTPGTLTVGVDRVHGRFQVHALVAEGEDSLRTGDMERRVAAFEGGS